LFEPPNPPRGNRTGCSSDQHYQRTGGKNERFILPDGNGFETSTELEQRTLYVRKCDCSCRAHIWYTPVHPIRVVQPGKFWYTLGYHKDETVELARKAF